MNKQPQAMRLADILENKIPRITLACLEVSATELRRLHNINAELLAALKGLRHVCEIALEGKNGEQHVYFETRRGHFVEASVSMRMAEFAIAQATRESDA